METQSTSIGIRHVAERLRTMPFAFVENITDGIGRDPVPNSGVYTKNGAAAGESSSGPETGAGRKGESSLETDDANAGNKTAGIFQVFVQGDLCPAAPASTSATAGSGNDDAVAARRSVLVPSPPLSASFLVSSLTLMEYSNHLNTG